jgi:peptidoglycan hydrolase CwlO-like protein
VAECHSGTRLSRFNVTRFIAVAGIVALVWLPSTAHAQTTQSRIDTMNASVEAAAQRWFDAQAHAQQIAAGIKQVEAQLRDAAALVARVRVVATARAIDIYKGASVSYSGLFGTTAIDSARREQLINSANAESENALNALATAVDTLNGRRRDLLAQQAAEQKTLQEIAGERANLDNQLASLRAQLSRAAARRAEVVAVHVAGQYAPPTAPTVATVRVPAPAVVPVSAASVASSGGEYPHHDDPFLVCTRTRESSNNYAAVSPSGYYGAYQFLPSTWDVAAIRGGRSDLVGVLPSQASEYDQDELAWTLYLWQGKTPWGGRC